MLGPHGVLTGRVLGPHDPLTFRSGSPGSSDFVSEGLVQYGIPVFSFQEQPPAEQALFSVTILLWQMS